MCTSRLARPHQSPVRTEGYGRPIVILGAVGDLDAFHRSPFARDPVEQDVEDESFLRARFRKELPLLLADRFSQFFQHQQHVFHTLRLSVIDLSAQQIGWMVGRHHRDALKSSQRPRKRPTGSVFPSRPSTAVASSATTHGLWLDELDLFFQPRQAGAAFPSASVCDCRWSLPACQGRHQAHCRYRHPSRVSHHGLDDLGSGAGQLEPTKGSP